MARCNFKNWVQNYHNAQEDLRRAQKKVSDLESVASLVKDARIDILDELREELQLEFNEARSRQTSSDKPSGVLRGLGRAIELIDELKKEVRNGEAADSRRISR